MNDNNVIDDMQTPPSKMSKSKDYKEKYFLFELFFINGVSGDGKKNSVPEMSDKTSAVGRSFTIPPPQQNATNVTIAAKATAGTTTFLNMSNVTQSSALDDAHLQRTLLKPKFLTENSSTVVAQTGASSRISCLVANLGDCVVSAPLKCLSNVHH